MHSATAEECEQTGARLLHEMGAMAGESGGGATEVGAR